MNITKLLNKDHFVLHLSSVQRVRIFAALAVKFSIRDMKKDVFDENLTIFKYQSLVLFYWSFIRTQIWLKVLSICPGQAKKVSTMFSSATPYKNQRYDILKKECQENKELFEDSEFPCNNTSLFYRNPLPGRVEWKRPGVRHCCWTLDSDWSEVID